MSDADHLFPVTDAALAATRTTAADYAAGYARSLNDPDGFWRDQVTRLDWMTPPTKMGNWSWDPVDIKWFEDGVLNVSVNCLDRHLPQHADTIAIVWEGDDPKTPVRRISYGELHAETCRMANALIGLGVQKGDRVTLYMPMIPEAAMAMLACARIGAVHSVVFGGFAAAELATRIADAKPRAIVTASCGLEPGRIVKYKPLIDAAIGLCQERIVDDRGGALCPGTGATAPLSLLLASSWADFGPERWWAAAVGGHSSEHRRRHRRRTDRQDLQDRRRRRSNEDR